MFCHAISAAARMTRLWPRLSALIGAALCALRERSGARLTRRHLRLKHCGGGATWTNAPLIRTTYRSMVFKMIRSISCKDTQRIWQGQSSRKFPGDIQDRALRKLRQLDAATVLEDLRNPPGNRLEVLKGSRIGQMSIRINDQWRICFRWVDHDAWDVEIVDYH